MLALVESGRVGHAEMMACRSAGNWGSAAPFTSDFARPCSEMPVFALALVDVSSPSTATFGNRWHQRAHLRPSLQFAQTWAFSFEPGPLLRPCTRSHPSAPLSVLRAHTGGASRLPRWPLHRQFPSPGELRWVRTTWIAGAPFVGKQPPPFLASVVSLRLPWSIRIPAWASAPR